MTLGVLSSGEKAKLKNLIDFGVETLENVATAKEVLKDVKLQVVEVAEELNISKVVLNKAIQIAYKNNQNKDKISKTREELDEVEQVMMAAGRA